MRSTVRCAKLLLFATWWPRRVLQMILHICRIIFVTIDFILAIERKEVAAQHGTDALQQYRVDALALEDVINVGTVTVEALGQPRCAAPLPAQLSFNLSTDVYHHNRPDILQQLPAATWLIFHQHENKKNSLQSVLILNLTVWNPAVGFRIIDRKTTTRQGIVLPVVLIYNCLKIENQTLKKNSDFILTKYSAQT